MALPATESFTDTTGTALTTHSASWSLNIGDFSIQSNELAANGVLAADLCAARWNADAFPSDQYAQATLSSKGAVINARIGVGVRIATDGSANYYGLYYDDDASETTMFKVIAGVWSAIGAVFAGNRIVGDVLRLEIVGTTLQYFLNGVSQGTRTDSDLSSGSAGVVGRGLTTGHRIDNWEGGSLVTAPVDQEGFRFRNDNGSESAATWLAAQDTNVTQPLSTNTRLRMLLNATGDPASFQGRLDYKKSTDSVYVPVLLAQPSLTPSELTAGASTSNVLTYATASVTLKAGATYLIGIVHTDAASEQDLASVATTGGAVAFTQVASVPFNTIATNVSRLELWKAVPTADVTDTITITLNDAGTGCAWILREYIDADVSLGTPATNNANAATSVAATPGALAAATSHQVAFGAHDLNSTADTASGTNWSSVGTGQTYNTPATAIESAVNTSGSASQVTFSGAGAADRAVIAVEIKQKPSQPILMAASANIAASGAATTAQLTPPSGKATTDFVAGRIQDDENPADAVDITTDDYTEFEWCLTAVSGTAVNGDVYQFRVTKGGVALDTYTLTPQWTIGTAGTSASGSGLAKSAGRVTASGFKSASGAAASRSATRTTSVAQKGAISFGRASTSSRAIAVGASAPVAAGSGSASSASRVTATGTKAVAGAGVVRSSSRSASAGSKGAIGLGMVRDSTFLLSAGIKGAIGAAVASSSERVISFGSSVAIIQGSGTARSSSRVTASGAKAGFGSALTRTSSRTITALAQKGAVGAAAVKTSGRITTAGPTARSGFGKIATAARSIAAAFKSVAGTGKVSTSSQVVVLTRLEIITAAMAVSRGTFSLAGAEEKTVSLTHASDRTISLHPTE